MDNSTANAWAWLGIRRLAAADGHTLDSHGDVIGKLRSVHDIPVVAGVDDVAHGQLLPFVVWTPANAAVGDLDLKP